MIGHLGHFLLDFFGQIWTQGTLRHILGTIMVIFEICHFLTIPGPFEYFSENGWSQKIKVFLMKEQLLAPYQFRFSFRRAGPKINHGSIWFLIQNTWRGLLWAIESPVPLESVHRCGLGVLLNLFWIFDYFTSVLFAGPLSTDCPDVEKVIKFL